MGEASQIMNHAELEEQLKSFRAEKERFSDGRKKHSLDSDEEDEDEKIKKYNVMDPEEFEGQEAKTIEFDGEIRITPFNMKEELEEGYFDRDGTYIFQKEVDEVKDQWLDDIDWVKVKATESVKRKRTSDSGEDSDSNDGLPALDVVDHYRQMLELMMPRETVQSAIRRLGGGRSSSSRRKKKKEEEETEELGERLQQLIGLANALVQSGDLDIYEQTFEKLQHLVNSQGKKFEASSDMFGEEFNETQASKDAAEPADSEVMWEFKWESADDAKVYGPYPTSQMLQWVQDKYFDEGVLVRQMEKRDGPFYSSKRIDFELYL